MSATNPLIRSALRKALYSSVTVPLLFVAPQSLAQEDDEPLEEIVTTGSRIARDPNLGGAVPVQSLAGEDIQLSGQTDIVEVLNDLPALLTSTSSTNSAIGVFGSGSGETAGAAEVGESILQLRGLGIERTLVLVNGRRHVSGVGGSQAVDVGSIPSNLIERVEVLTGGASAIYGADAVTGVVNFIMKDDYEGFSIDLQAGISGEGDGEDYQISALWGTNFADDRGNIAIGVTYADRSVVLHGDRDWSRDNGVASDDQNPLRRFQTGDIDPSTTPNFAAFYSPGNAFASSDGPCDLFGINYCYGFHPTGFPILSESEFSNLYTQAFGAAPALTDAERALIDRASTAPTRAILPGHNFSLTSPGGVLVNGGLFDPGLDLDNDGTSDCMQSYQGYYATYSFSPPALGFIGGCWIIQDDGSVRPLQDGLIAGDINQFGVDGIWDSYNEDELLPDNEKITVNLFGHYDFSDAVSFFYEAKWATQETISRSPGNTFWDLLTIAPDNPYLSQLPPALAAVGQSEGMFITRDPLDLGFNADKGTRETTRIVLGLEGELDNGFLWEVSANYGNFELEYEDRNRVIVDRWFAAIDAVDDGSGNVVCRSDLDPTPPPTTPFGIPAFDSGFFTFNPGDGTCQPANILGGVGGISQAAIDFTSATVVNNFETDQLVLNATVTGELFDMPAGSVAFAAGLEYREEESTSIFDPLVRGVLPVSTAFGNQGQLLSDIFAGVPDTQRSLVFDSESLIQNVVGKYDVTDVFAEFSVPLLEGAPLAEELTFDAAIRFSDYSTVGSTTTWMSRTSWAPTQDLRIRGAYSIAVRAPNIDELFSPAQGAFFRPVDPCDSAEIAALNAANDPRGPIRAANCAAAGISPTFTDPLTARFVGETSGNPELSEEEAETITVGFVYEPEWASGLSVTIDYWNIEIDDAIDTPSGQDIVDNCYDSASFPDNQFCALVRRNDDPGSPQFNGLEFIRQQQLNIGKLEAAGVDFNLLYVFDYDAFDIRTGLSGTWMDKLDRFFDPGDPTAVDPELGEIQRPELAATFNVGIASDRWAVDWTTTYLDEQALRDVEIETINQLYGPAGMSDETYIHNLTLNWDVSDTYRIYGGVNNISDEEPFITEFAYPVSPIGRYFFAGVNANFE